jgi:Fe-S cluster assembly protein SufD
MSNLQQVTTDFINEQASQKNPWLQGIRDAASERLRVLQLPTQKTEDWKYLKLEKLLADDQLDAQSMQLLDSKSDDDIDELLSQSLIKDLDAYRLVFVDGVFVSELSHLDSNPYSTLFSEANTAQQQLIIDHLDTSHNYYHDYFSSLNSAQLEDGLLVHIPEHCEVDKPFYIVNLTQSEQLKTNMMRLLIIAETGSKATVIEHEDAPLKHTAMVNTVIECFVNDKAHITHSRLQLDESVTSICSQTRSSQHLSTTSN